jgi:hypothetical protein
MAPVVCVCVRDVPADRIPMSRAPEGRKVDEQRRFSGGKCEIVDITLFGSSEQNCRDLSGKQMGPGDPHREIR